MDIQKRLKTLFYFMLWFGLNALFNIYSKKVLKIAPNIPWLITFIQLGTGFVLVLPTWGLGLRQKPDFKLKNDWNWLLPLGIFHALSSVGGVYAISSGAVSTFQVLKALEPIASSLLAAVLYRHVFSCHVYAAILMVIYGVIYSCWKGNMHISFQMFFGTTLSMIGASMRSLYSKQKMKDRKLAPENIFAMMNACTLLLLLPFTLLDFLKVGQVLQDMESTGLGTSTLLYWTVLSGVFFYTNNEVAFLALNQVHPITHAVGNILRRIIIVVCSMVFLGDQMTPQNINGASIAIVGVFLYSIAKHYSSNVFPPAGKKEKATAKRRMSASLVITFCSVLSFLMMYNYFAIIPHLHNTEDFHLYLPKIVPTIEPSQISEMLQPMVHYLRINDLQVHEFYHVFDRADELESSKDIAVKASNMVLCFKGITIEAAESLSKVWQEKLDGRFGTVELSPNANHSKFKNCNVIVSVGDTYQATASWAYKSPVPVINLWNVDGYYPQAAMLAFKRKISLNKTFAEGYSQAIRKIDAKLDLDCETFQEHQSMLRIRLKYEWVQKIWREPRLAAFREITHIGNCFCEDSLIHQVTGPTVTVAASALLASLAELSLAKAGQLPLSYQFPGVRCEPGIVVSGKISEHDQNFVYANNGSVLFALEWERVTKNKYSIADSPAIDGVSEFKKAATTAQSYAVNTFNFSEVALMIVVRAWWSLENGSYNINKTNGEKLLRDTFPNVPVVYQEQLLAHTIHAFFDSPFESAIVLSAHGAGSEPYSCGAYLAKRGIQPILLKPCGSGFDQMGKEYELASVQFIEVLKNKEPPLSTRKTLSTVGTFMGYSALGKSLPCLGSVKEILFSKDFFRSPLSTITLIREKCMEHYFNASQESLDMRDFPRNLPVEIQRDVAHTFEELFEVSFLHLLEGVAMELGEVDGIVLAGGCALNVKLSQRVWDFFDKPVWIPSAPSDDGLGVGGIWGNCQPPRKSVPLQYHGLPLFDMHHLQRHVKAWGASCEYLGFGASAAMKLARIMAVDKLIVALVVGNQEFGPRALSHRSLMAYPDSIEIRERMNALKFRQFYRPTCPTMIEEFVERMFVKPQNIHSPFMSFAPELQDWVQEELPAVRHFDNTARPQTLSATTEPFIHSILKSIPKVLKGGKPVVINTSFNIKGQPIINTVVDSLFMLCDRPQLDYLFIEGYLFALPGNATHSACKLLKEAHD